MNRSPTRKVNGPGADDHVGEIPTNDHRDKSDERHEIKLRNAQVHQNVAFCGREIIDSRCHLS